MACVSVSAYCWPGLLNAMSLALIADREGRLDPFRGEKIERMPEKSELYYYYSCYCAGIVPYVSPVANGYENLYFTINGSTY